MTTTATAATAAVLAHQGGWDEALYVAVPIALVIGLLALAQRRADDEHEADVRAVEPDEPDER